MKPEETIAIWLRTRGPESKRLYDYEIRKFLETANTTSHRLAFVDFEAALRRDARIPGIGQKRRFRAVWRTVCRILADAGHIPSAQAYVACSRLFFPAEIPNRERILDLLEDTNRDALFMKAIVTTGAPAIEVANLRRLHPLAAPEGWSRFDAGSRPARAWAMHPHFMGSEIGILPISRRIEPVRSSSTIRKWLGAAAKRFGLQNCLELDLRRLHIQIAVENGVPFRTALMQAEGFDIPSRVENMSSYHVAAALTRRFFGGFARRDRAPAKVLESVTLP